MDIVMETERLLLRKFTLDDAELIYTLNKDPEVIKYTGDPIADLVHARKIIEEVIMPQYTLYNHGRWAVHEKASGAFTGWCGLKYISERDEVDLGYRFMKQYWGKGYATESAAASIEYGFNALKLQRIIGRAMPDNKSSIAVLKKLGFHYIGTFVTDSHDAETYEKFKEDDAR
jgi:[ribosomal protein S5]-alanine N-acetyltransferase